MRETTVRLYQYSELSDEAKEKARRWFLDGQDFDYEWECLKADAEQIGLNLLNWEYRRYLNADLMNSPFEVIDKILKEHGEACETYKTALSYQVKFKNFSEDDEDETSCEHEALEELKAEFLHALEEDYRVLADRQFEYTESEEHISAMMDANEYEFLESGKRFVA